MTSDPRKKTSMFLHDHDEEATEAFNRMLAEGGEMAVAWDRDVDQGEVKNYQPMLFGMDKSGGLILVRSGPPSHPIIQVHDEILIEVHPEEKRWQWVEGKWVPLTAQEHLAIVMMEIDKLAKDIKIEDILEPPPGLRWEDMK